MPPPPIASSKRPRCRTRRGAAAVLAILLALAAPGGIGRTEEPVTLFAAASTANALTAVVAAFEAQGGGPVRTVFAASSTLARQIAQGAPADLYLSANVAWMDDLARRQAIETDSRIDLVGNTLVLIAPAASPLDLTIAPHFPLASALGKGRLVIGDPAHVPAGIYAKAALTRLGVWDAVEPKSAFAGDARAALALVDRGEAAAGIVYATDAAIGARVRVVAAFPAGLHEPIVYPLAIVRGRRGPAVEAFHRFLQGPRAGAVFRAHGFIQPGSTRPMAGG